MTNTELVQSEIERFLRSTTPEVLCIRGLWGIGKTFLWQKELKIAQVKKHLGLSRYAYVSLFGISTLDGLKMAIFENSPWLDQANDRDALNSGGEVAKRNRGLLGIVFPSFGKWLEQSGPLFFSTVKNEIICIDDLERRGQPLSINDVLGLASFLKEQRGCKIVLLLNDKELDDNASTQLSGLLEKVVDINLVFDPDSKDSARIALSDASEIGKQLSRHCISLGISNIRVIKRIERAVLEVAPLLDGLSPQVLSQAIQSMALLGWSTWQPGIAPPIAYIKKRNANIPRDFQQELTPEELSWHATLDAYEIGSLDEFDLELLQVIEKGYRDPERIKRFALALDARIRASEKEGSLEAAWSLYHRNFADNQDEY
jgi:hypothetical protein